MSDSQKIYVIIFKNNVNVVTRSTSDLQKYFQREDVTRVEIYDDPTQVSGILTDTQLKPLRYPIA